MSLPAANLREAQRVLDSAARRLLTEQRDTDAPNPSTGEDFSSRNGGPDERPLFLHRQSLPVRIDANRQSRVEAA